MLPFGSICKFQETRRQFESYAQWLSVYCRERNIPTIDFHQVFMREDGSVRGELFSDALHPNANGHFLMAEKVCQELEAMRYLQL